MNIFQPQKERSITSIRVAVFTAVRRLDQFTQAIENDANRYSTRHPSSSRDPARESLYLGRSTVSNSRMAFDQTMKPKSRSGKTCIALIDLLGAIGCSKTAAESDPPEITEKKMIADIDIMAEEVLQSAEKMEAADWLKRFPQSSFGVNEQGQDLLLAPVVAKLKQAGAQRVVIEYAMLGQAHVLASMVVLLPKDPTARQKLFEIDKQLAPLCEETPVADKGQKYLHYSFD